MADYQTADGPLGRRLIPHIIDKNAAAKPDAECFQVPRSAEPRDGWEVITWKQFARAIDTIAHGIVKECGLAEIGKFPAIAYIGLNDARYVVSRTAFLPFFCTILTMAQAFFVAAVKAGYQVGENRPREG